MWFVDCGFIWETVTAEDSARAWRHGAGPPFAVLFAVVFFCLYFDQYPPGIGQGEDSPRFEGELFCYIHLFCFAARCAFVLDRQREKWHCHELGVGQGNPGICHHWVGSMVLVPKRHLGLWVSASWSGRVGKTGPKI